MVSDRGLYDKTAIALLALYPKMIDDLRARQQQQQQQAIDRLRSGSPAYRIGDRDPVTGKHGLIHPDGSVTGGAEKIYSAAHQYGDRVLANRRTDGTWLLSEAGARQGRKVASASPLPRRERKRSRVYVLYDHDGGLWVGGHQANPVRICDRPIGLRQAFIWGDLQGWEVSLLRNPATPNNPYQPTAISSVGTRVDIDNPDGEFFPLGAGYWEVLNKNKVFNPSDNPVGQVGLPQPLVWNFSCEAGYWSALGGYTLGRSTYSRNATEAPVAWNPTIFNTTENNTGNTSCPSPPTGKILASSSTYSASRAPSQFGQTVATLSRSTDATRIWMCDRISSLSIRGLTSATLAGTDPNRVSVYREFQGSSNQIGTTLAGEYQSIANPYGISDTARLHETMTSVIWSGRQGMSNYRVQAPTGGIYTPTGSSLTVPATNDYWYTNGKMTIVTNSEANKLKLAAQNITVKEVDVSGTETSFDVFAYSIPSTANLYSYCGCLI